MSHTSDLAFTPLSDAFAQDPYPFYAALRANDGLTYFEDFDVWLASRFDDVSEIVSDVDFYRRDHRLIFRAIAQLAELGKPFDVVTLGEALDNAGVLDDCGGMAYLAQGNEVSAKTHLERAVNANVEFRGLDEAKDALGKLSS